MRHVKNYVKIATVYFLACSMFFNLPQMIVLANPTGGAFTHGTGTITEGPTTTIVTDQTRTSIDWATFNISGGNSVIFDQPTANSATLNRIFQGSPSEINGTLIGIVGGNIGGRILLVNPAGVIFGNGSSVNATQVTAAALNLNDAQIASWAGGSNDPLVFDLLVNPGDYTVWDPVAPDNFTVKVNGDGIFDGVTEGVLLLGRQIINSGTINMNGYVMMVAGDQVTIVNPESPNISVVIDAGTIANTIDNQSPITAGGKILLAASGDIFSAALTASGSVTLDGVATLGGDVTGDGITFTDAVTADGGNQTFDATSGTLQADSTITKTTAGDLALAGNAVNLVGAVDVQDGALAITGVIDADAALTASGSVTLDGVATLGGDLTGDGITFTTAVMADGGNQTFDATSGTLQADSTITKTTAGNLTLGGDTDINLDGTVDVQSGALNVTDAAAIAADVYGDGITFDGAVTADGTVDQTFDARTGTLQANSTITKTTAGDLALAGNAVNLVGAVDVQDGALAITGVIDADAALTASGSVTLDGVATLGGDLTGDGITFTDAVTADGGNQTFDATSGTLQADSTITKTTAGDLALGGDTGISLDGTVDVQSGDLFISDNAILAPGKTLKAGSDVVLADGKILTGQGALTVIAGNMIREEGGDGVMKLVMQADDTTLTLDQAADLLLANFDVDNANNTNLNANSSGSISDLAADQWKTVTADAGGDITLEGANAGRDITVNTLTSGGSIWVKDTSDGIIAKGTITTTGANGGNIEIHAKNDIQIGKPVDATAGKGGVKIVSESESIYTNSVAEGLNVSITGYSDGTKGVDLPDGGKAAVIIQAMEKDLRLGQDAVITAIGEYNSSADDRLGANILNDDTPAAGDPIDIAILLSSYNYDINDQKGGNIFVDSTDIDSTMGIDLGGVKSYLGSTVVFDAREKVDFSDAFIAYLKDGNSKITRIEAITRRYGTLNEVKLNNYLPAATEALDSINPFLPTVYVLRGEDLAKVLALLDNPTLPSLAVENVEPAFDSDPVDVQDLLEWAQRQFGKDFKIYFDKAAGPEYYDVSWIPSNIPLKSLLALREREEIITDYATPVAVLQVVLGQASEGMPLSTEMIASQLQQTALVTQADSDATVAFLAAIEDSIMIQMTTSGEYAELGLTSTDVDSYLAKILLDPVEDIDQDVAVLLSDFIGAWTALYAF